MVDTGFTGELCLPADTIAVLGLHFRYDLLARLADNSEEMLPVHDATVLWNGMGMEINVIATGKRPLLGLALLDGYELHSQFREKGLVTIEAL